MVNIYIYANGKKCKLPVNPAQIECAREGDNQSVNIVGYGERTIIQRPKLRTIPLDGEFPRYEQDSYNAKNSYFHMPKWYISFFEGWQSSLQAGRLICAEYSIDMTVTLEAFSYVREGGTEDVSYVMTLKEYVPMTVQQIAIKTSSSSGKKTATKTQTTARTNTSAKVAVGSNVVVSGTLYKTSRKNGAGKTLKNYKGKINLQAMGAKCPWHIVTPAGAYLGWVEDKAVKLA
ncbi:MAG: hypothetical protein LBQ80_04170 [Clostridium sp.]|jgi:hypothetical protein|nr:hypothetical protein [Clostridium sp.]